MTKHYKIYTEHFGYMPGEAIKCELSGLVSKNNELHHLECRGMGGRPSMDRIDNIMCLRKDLHLLYGDKKQNMDFLKEAHKLFMGDGLSWVERGGELPGFSEEPKINCQNYFNEG
jgi:hypothetical protein